VAPLKRRKAAQGLREGSATIAHLTARIVACPVHRTVAPHAGAEAPGWGLRPKVQPELLAHDNGIEVCPGSCVAIGISGRLTLPSRATMITCRDQ
jgi:hypothetical protein